MANVIQHCGKSRPTQEELRIKDYPGPGDFTFVKRCRCVDCKQWAYARSFQYAGCETVTEWYGDTPKKVRRAIEQRIREGVGVEWIQRNGKDNKQTRWRQHAGEYTMTTKQAADSVLGYLNKLEKASMINAS